ncbi:MAG: toll/interleukin-1 receptor domain-containing protein [Gammaproteobacteria bacterium]|nr:toll/interleukin-1 receptor domain-containing protein [Gammaproteobacteria bacterium]
MSYKYQFDSTTIGDLRLPRRRYEELHRAYRLMRDELDQWNQRVAQEGPAQGPFIREVADLDHVIDWGEAKLANPDAQEIFVRGISVGSIRYIKAALLFEVHQRRCDRDAKRDQGWPDAALRSLDDAIEQIQRTADGFDQEPNNVLWELIPRDNGLSAARDGEPETLHDVFISHASEDKDSFVRPLANALEAAGFSVWFDEFSLTVGDSLRRSIDRGLASSRFGIVVLSPRFMTKEWPQKELDGLSAREVDGTKVILPVWLDLTADQVRTYSPTLADRKAAVSSDGLSQVVADLVKAMAR